MGIFSDFCIIIGAVACVPAQSGNPILVGRFISGIGIGLSVPAVTPYLAEVCPCEFRGRGVMLHGVLIACGILAGSLLGLLLGPPPINGVKFVTHFEDIWWRFLFGLPGVVALLQMSLFLWAIPVDSPTFYLKRNQTADATRVLYRIYGLQEPQLDGSRKVEHIQQQLEELARAAWEAREGPRVRIIQAVFDPYYQRAVMVGLGLACFQMANGINAVMSYSNSLFLQAGIPASSVRLTTALMSAINVLVAVFSSTIVDRWGRRPVLLAGGFFQFLAMLVLSQVFWLPFPKVVTVVCLVVYATA